ncbi:sensor histidine kinase [Novosphingobium sp. ZW T3_23]|uniref:sensor histidine kinase n=1 Tax=Novosphingobium sp. ZW T3_23 TaxID=3378084 RepID=UPI0038535C97
MRALTQVLPLDMFFVGPEGEVIAAKICDPALGVQDMDFHQAVVGMTFERVLERMPLDDDTRADLRNDVFRVIEGAAESICRNYPLHASIAEELGVEAAKVAEPVGATLVVLRTRRKEADPRSRGAERTQLHLAQEEERRRIARELHDGTAQHVAVAQVMLETVRKARTFEAIDKACLDIEAALSTAQHQMRTLSYVLHPPELASGGIVEALATFLKGFARRTGLKVGFHNYAGQLRPSAALKLALYRVAQEALVNVSRHASARSVDVRLRTAAKHIVLEIEDDGVGIADDIVAGRRREAIGVGLSGMRERVEALGGVFCLERRRTGTLVGAFFPQRRKGDAAEEAVKAQRYCSEPHRARVRRSS